MVLSSMEPRVTPEQAEQVLDADWPVEVGEYFLGNPAGPVAVSTLASPELAQPIHQAVPQVVSLSGKTETPNLGVEKVVKNIVSNPRIRFLLVCGFDSLDLFPGDALVNLSRNGIDDERRIIGARGKSSILQNLSLEEVEHFRKQVEVVDLVGCQDLAIILREIELAATRSPGPFTSRMQVSSMKRVEAKMPSKTRLDPAGFFVIYLDRDKGKLVLEHYENKGRMTRALEGADAASLYCTAIELELVTRLDHAAYLGRELARAEAALKAGQQYKQDKAPGE